MSNPYHGLEDYRFWRRAISSVEPHRFDPVTRPRFTISPGDKVATAGSCFAQHIARKLSSLGFDYYVPEDAAHLSAAERAERNFGVFSARYGNVYTAAQLLQLFREAMDGEVPHESVWVRPDGRYADPYRSQIEPAGFESPEAVLADRAEHLEQVRQVFTEPEIFVFTLGLTEAWRSKQDHRVFPVAPGVAAGNFDPDQHEFVNFDAAEVISDLTTFLTRLKAVNPKVRVLLTVSPVPLMATYEDRNVLVSTTYSKAVLRVAAEAMLKAFDWVDYFPSYEIITGSLTGGLYYEDDFREVSPIGVAHAMRSFAANYAAGGRRPEQDNAPYVPTFESSVVCDEEAIDHVRR